MSTASTHASVYDLLFTALKTMEQTSGNHSFSAARNKNDAKFKLSVKAGLSGSHVEVGTITYVEAPGRTFGGQLLDAAYITQLSHDLAKKSDNVSREAQIAFGAIIGTLTDGVLVTETSIGFVSGKNTGNRLNLKLRGHVVDIENNPVGILSMEFAFQRQPGRR